MADAPFDTTTSRNDELERPTADVLAGGGSSSGRQTTKMSALRNFFKHSPSNKSGAATPRSGGTSARRAAAAAGTHHVSVSGEDDFDDHMLGSMYQGTDICKACGFRRGSSVCCPVTRCHHGTDEVMTPGKHRHNRTASGRMNIMAKIREKLPLTPGRRSNHRGCDDGEEAHTPQTGELLSLSLTANAEPDAECDDAKMKGTPLTHNHTMGPPGGSGEFDGEEGGDASSASANYARSATLDAYASGDSPAEEVQYYCYTDENGDTYYYTQELRESVQDATQAPQQPSCAEDEGDAATSATSAAAAAYDLPEGSYVYQYVDENGQTVNCLCTPQAGDESPATDHDGIGGEGVADKATPATSATAHAGSDTGNSSEADDEGTSRKKASSSFFAAIQSVFRSRRGSHAHQQQQQQHVDPLNTGASSTSVHTPQSSFGLDSNTNELVATMQGCVETNEYDSDVTAFMELLDPNERKKFLKVRKNLIKELFASEKKERESIMKNRQDGMSAFTRDKLAAAFAIRKDERTIKTGHKRGEPL
jgi:hypothetical protein